jgi:EXPERA (EXPanded EBP superfamily)
MNSTRDRAAIALILFFLASAFTLELYFVIESRRLPERRDLPARAFAVYAQGDRAYYDHVTDFERGLESFHILFTQPLNLILLFGIVRRAAWRYPLQLGVGSYVCYSTALYLLSDHLARYDEMPRHNVPSFLIFYLPNLPWLLGNAWLAWDALRAIVAAFRKIERRVPAI